MYHKLKKVFRNIYRKTPVLESPFNRLAGFKTCNFFNKRLQQRCFPVNIIKFLRTLISKKFCKQLLLPFLLLTVNISSQELVSALNSIVALQRSSSRFKEFSLGYLVVGSSLIRKMKNQPKWSLVAIRCTIRCPTCCHSLLLVVTRCTTCCHSSSLVVTRCTTRLSLYKLYFLNLVETSN